MIRILYVTKYLMYTRFLNPMLSSVLGILTLGIKNVQNTI